MRAKIQTHPSKRSEWLHTADALMQGNLGVRSPTSGSLVHHPQYRGKDVKQRTRRQRKAQKKRNIEYEKYLRSPQWKAFRAEVLKRCAGKCERCGYSKCVDALDFHHLDPKSKDFNISKNGNTRSWEEIKKELDKCIMLCANCHREEHAKGE